MHHASDHPALRWFEAGLFAILIVATLAPVWLTDHFPTQDGPAHVDSAATILRWLSGNAAVREHYDLNAFPVPNLLGHLLLMGLMSFLPHAAAEKVLVSLCLAIIPLGARQAIGAVRPQSRFLATLAIPLAANRLLYMGFYNFSLGLGLMLLTLGYWMRRRDDLTPRRSIMLGILALLTYLAHLSAIIPLLLLLAATPPLPPRGRALRNALLALVPTLTLTTISIFSQPSLAGPQQVRIGEHLLKLLELDVLIAHDERAMFVAAGLAQLLGLCLLYAAVYRFLRRCAMRLDLLLIPLALMVCLYALARGRGAEKVYLAERLSLLAVLMLILWLASCEWHRIIRIAVPTLASAATLGFVWLNARAQIQLDAQMAEYSSAARHVPPGSTLLALCFSPQGVDARGEPLSSRTSPFLHASGHIAARCAAIDLGNYEAHVGHFPLRYRPGRDPFTIMNVREPTHHRAPRVDSSRWSIAVGRPIDFILIFGLRTDHQNDADAARMLDWVHANYDSIAVSSPTGAMRLYRHREHGRLPPPPPIPRAGAVSR